MWWITFLIHAGATTTSPIPVASDVVLEKIHDAQTRIADDERRQREALSHLFVINQRVREISRRQGLLNQRLLTDEANVRALAQEVGRLELRTDQQKSMLNHRLRRLYQERNQNNLTWLFSTHSIVEIERNQRFLKRMIDSDYRHLKLYVENLDGLRRKRHDLKKMVARVAGLGKEAQARENELHVELREKSRFIASLMEARNSQLSELKVLRNQRQHEPVNDLPSYAFFERKGLLSPPLEAAVRREFGTYVDPHFHFRLTHKGLFYGSDVGSQVKSVFRGRVVFANRIPGYGRTVIVDHGDNYYSVYAFASQLRVQENVAVKEGDLLALSGAGSPLFGPGLYFEIRHFTDAVDPRPWIKDSVLKTAESF